VLGVHVLIPLFSADFPLFDAKIPLLGAKSLVRQVNEIEA
jgi:hypothetical protein